MDYFLRLFFPVIQTTGRERNTHRRSRRRTVFLLSWVIAFIFVSIVADAAEILVVTSGSSSVYEEVTDSFALSFCDKRSRTCKESYEVIYLDEVDENKLRSRMRENRRLIVTIGRQAAVNVASLNPEVPILHTLIPHKVFQQLPKSNRAPSVSAIFIDQPIQRRLLLLKVAMPDRTRVGVLVSPASKEIEYDIARNAKRYGLHPIFERLDDEKQLGSVLKQLLDRSDVLLATPDPFIFNRNTVRNILLSSYHHQTPVIGFSAAYVKAGAIAAVFSTPEEIGRQAGEVAAKYLTDQNDRLPPPAYPKYFSVVSNQSVSNSLQIVLPTAEQLEARLREASK